MQPCLMILLMSIRKLNHANRKTSSADMHPVIVSMPQGMLQEPSKYYRLTLLEQVSNKKKAKHYTHWADTFA